MLNCLIYLSLPLFIILKEMLPSSQAIIWYTTLDQEPLILLWWNMKEQTVMILKKEMEMTSSGVQILTLHYWSMLF